MKNFGIIYNKKEEIPQSEFLDLFNWLEENNINYYFNKKLAWLNKIDHRICSKDEMIDKAEIFIVMGGDGSILEVSRELVRLNKLILGVNFGTLGFLTDISFSNLKNCIIKIINDDFWVEERMLLKLSVGSKSLIALNDMVVDNGVNFRLIKLEVSINDKHFSTYTANGLLVSTPTGSTAYNLSSNGPIVEPHVKALILNPLCPHALAMRPMLVSDDSEIKIVVESELKEILIFADGQQTLSVQTPATIKIKKFFGKARFIRFEDYSYYQLLREKLGWGGFKKRFKRI